MIKRKYLIISLCLLSLISIFFMLRWDRFGFSSVKWGDLIKYKGITYEGQYNGNDERVMIAENYIGELFGTTNFKLQGNVHNPYYRMRNGDACILAEKTELYKINNEKYTKSIAVKIDNSYYLYSNIK